MGFSWKEHKKQRGLKDYTPDLRSLFQIDDNPSDHVIDDTDLHCINIL